MATKNYTVPANLRGRCALFVQVLMKAPMTMEAACGFVGNALIESGGKLDPNAWNPHDPVNPSGGICQWHEGRLTRLQEFAKKHGKPWNDLDIQMAYAVEELLTKEKNAYNAVKNCTNVERASEIVGDKFERFQGHENFNNQNHINRKQRSRAVYEGVKNEHWEADAGQAYSASDDTTNDSETSAAAPPPNEDATTIYDEMVDVDNKGDLDNPFEDLSAFAKFANIDDEDDDVNDVFQNTANVKNEQATTVEDELSKVKSDQPEVLPPVQEQIKKPTTSTQEHSWATTPNADESQKREVDSGNANDESFDQKLIDEIYAI